MPKARGQDVDEDLLDMEEDRQLRWETDSGEWYWDDRSGTWHVDENGVVQVGDIMDEPKPQPPVNAMIDVIRRAYKK